MELLKLRRDLRDRGLEYTGRKAVLEERLMAAVKAENVAMPSFRKVLTAQRHQPGRSLQDRLGVRQPLHHLPDPGKIKISRLEKKLTFSK